MKLYQKLATTIEARENCREHSNDEWFKRHTETLEKLNDLMPSGSGFDNGTRLLPSKSTPDKLVFETAFHHLNEHGMYDGWTEHRVTVRPSFVRGFELKISGRNRNDIKDHMYEVFAAALETEVGP
jgi:hypothetical protein